jgi:hypothetical protein
MSQILHIIYCQTYSLCIDKNQMSLPWSLYSCPSSDIYWISILVLCLFTLSVHTDFGTV